VSSSVAELGLTYVRHWTCYGRVDDRSQWTRRHGPWSLEGDVYARVYRYYPLVLLRGPSGAWCGYVGIPAGHPWHGADEAALGHVAVHGGVTYSRSADEGIETLAEIADELRRPVTWFVGFDCNHFGDQNLLRGSRIRGAYRNVHYAAWEAIELAAVADKSKYTQLRSRG
jgi:hypothetical protein